MDTPEEFASTIKNHPSIEAASAAAIRKGMHEFGTLTATQRIAAEVPPEVLLTLVGRHMRGDWGDLDPEDTEANKNALIRGLRIVSAYETEEHGKIWIITEADRSATTVLFPEEY